MARSTVYMKENSMSDKKLIVEPGGGLGNRILTLVSAFNLARDIGIDDITVLWRNNNECGCEYEDVFSALPMKCSVKGIHFGKESYKSLLKRGNVFEIARKFLHQMFYNIFRRVVRCIQLDTKEGYNSREDWDKIKEQALSTKSKTIYIEAYYPFYGDISCDGISFNKKIADKLSAFKEKNGQYVAMHIRRTDNEIAIKNSPTELFYSKVEELVKQKASVKIYIATDDRNILEDLQNKYPDNIISEALGKNLSRRSTEGIQFALYEMMILAGAGTIYASFGSTFSQIANLIGGNEMIVVKK